MGEDESLNVDETVPETEVEENPVSSDSLEYSLADGVAEDESISEELAVSESESVPDSTNDSSSENDIYGATGEFVGWAYLVDSEASAEAETEEEVIEVSAPVFYSEVSAEYTVYGSYADLSITHDGLTYEFLVPSEQLDKLIVKVGTDGSLILINNSGSNVILQGKGNYESASATSFYQLTIPATNLASSVYNYGGYCYITTYYVENTSLRSQNNYLSNPLTGSLSTDNLSEDYTSTPSFYSYVMGMLFLLVAMMMSLSFKWRSKLRDK